MWAEARGPTTAVVTGVAHAHGDAATSNPPSDRAIQSYSLALHSECNGGFEKNSSWFSPAPLLEFRNANSKLKSPGWPTLYRPF